MGENEIKRLKLGFDEALKEGIMRALGVTKGAYECCVCYCTISGELQAMQHSVGAKHLSRCQTHKHNLMTNNSSDDNSDKGSNTSLASTSPTHEVIGRIEPRRSLPLPIYLNEEKSQHFYCKMCLTGFTGPKPYEDHMNGRQHRKKLAQVSILNNHHQESRSSTPSPTPSSNTPPPSLGKPVHGFDPCIVESGQGGEKYQCTVCNGLLLNGINTISQHLSGRMHLKNARLQNQKQEGPIPKKRYISESPRPSPPKSPLCPERFEASVSLKNEPYNNQNDTSDDHAYVNFRVIHTHEAITDLF